MHKKFVASAAKVPDAIQFPVENTFAPIKSRFHKYSHQGLCETPAGMVWAIKRSFAEMATKDHIGDCFRHGEENMQVFMGTLDQVVTINGKDFHCTEGGWLPRERRG